MSFGDRYTDEQSRVGAVALLMAVLVKYRPGIGNAHFWPVERPDPIEAKRGTSDDVMESTKGDEVDQDR